MNLRHISSFLLALLTLPPESSAQTNIQKTLETFSYSIGTVGLGTPQYQFFEMKGALKRTDDGLFDFRTEYEQPVGKNGVKNIAYYFTTKEQLKLYEIIVELDDARLSRGLAEGLLGKPNYPGKDDHWIAGASENIVSVAWLFDNKFILAANIGGSEWEGDPLFTLPQGYEPYKHLSNMSEWEPADLQRFVFTLERQVAARDNGFSAIRGRQTGADHACMEPLAGAEKAVIRQNETGKWSVLNTLISGATAENAILWKMDAQQSLSRMSFDQLRLNAIKPQSTAKGPVEQWELADKDGKKLPIRLGLIAYESETRGLWNVDILVFEPEQ